ncbi:MAG: hypothetical protein HQL25_07345 [Candidatus Omnitrophica bacterium]|nr:hypothetical protein [Candidatus Omnitrophota bacterium]
MNFKKILKEVLVALLQIIGAFIVLILLLKGCDRPEMISSQKLECASLDLKVKTFREAIGLAVYHNYSYLYLRNKKLGVIEYYENSKGGSFSLMPILKKYGINVYPVYDFSKEEEYRLNILSIDPKKTPPDKFQEIGVCLKNNISQLSGDKSIHYLIYASEKYLSGDSPDSPWHFTCLSKQYLTGSPSGFCVNTIMLLQSKPDSECRRFDSKNDAQRYGDLVNTCWNYEGKNILEFYKEMGYQ